jgi:hypothetical protein
MSQADDLQQPDDRPNPPTWTTTASQADEAREDCMLKINGVEVPEDSKSDLYELIAILGEEHLLSVRRVRAESKLAIRTIKPGEKLTFKAIPFEVTIERTQP